MSTTQDALPGFTRLDRNTYTHGLDNNGSVSAARRGNDAPDIIVLCTWMGAATKHIKKYTDPYLVRYPDVPILLIRCHFSDFMFPRFTAPNGEFPVPADILFAFTSQIRTQGASPRVLMHVFSNGGCLSAVRLAKAYRTLSTTKANDDHRLPLTALLIDSAPSLVHVKRSYYAMMQALPQNPLIKFVGSLFIWFVIGSAWLTEKLRLRENMVLQLRRELNDLHGSFLKDVPRTYICSKTDSMVPLPDVLAHAKDAKTCLQKAGETEVDKKVQTEEFHGSAHVGHIRVDEKRYWAVLYALWHRATKA